MRYFYLVLLVVALGLFWLTEETLEGEMRVVDTAVLSRFQVWRAPALDRLAVGISLLGAAPGTLLMTILAYLKLARRDGRTLLVVMAGGTVLTVCLKQIFAVTRPSPVDSLLPAAGFSYPSGHALMAVCLYGYLGFLAWRARKPWLTALCLALVLSIEWSRLYLNVHWPSDILAGTLTASLWLAFCLSQRR